MILRMMETNLISDKSSMYNKTATTLQAPYDHAKFVKRDIHG